MSRSKNKTSEDNRIIVNKLKTSKSNALEIYTIALKIRWEVGKYIARYPLSQPKFEIFKPQLIITSTSSIPLVKSEINRITMPKTNKGM